MVQKFLELLYIRLGLLRIILSRLLFWNRFARLKVIDVVSWVKLWTLLYSSTKLHRFVRKWFRLRLNWAFINGRRRYWNLLHLILSLRWLLWSDLLHHTTFKRRLLYDWLCVKSSFWSRLTHICERYCWLIDIFMTWFTVPTVFAILKWKRHRSIF